MSKTNEIEVGLLETCDYALLSQDNKLSVIGIFDQIFVRNIPSSHSKMFIVAIIKGVPGSKHNLEVAIKDPSGKDVLPTLKVESVIGPNGRFNILADLGALPIPTTGEYKVELSSLGVLIGSRLFNVFKANQTNDGTKRSSKYSN